MPTVDVLTFEACPNADSAQELIRRVVAELGVEASVRRCARRSNERHVPAEIGRDDVQRLVAGGAQLVEVLPREEYEEEHLPGASNLPLKGLNRQTAKRLNRAMPVVVYCWDST